jgi:hypothetical protein
MRTGNNGGYACSWLVGDSKTNEIAKIELTCNNVAFYRSMDGYYDGENFVDDSKMIREDCLTSRWDVANGGYWPFTFNCANSSSFRRMRWLALLDANKGAVDIDKAKEFLSDQIDPLTGEYAPGPKTIMSRWEIYAWPDAAPEGALDGMVATSELMATMSFWARFGHTDGTTFTWTEFFETEPYKTNFGWQKPYLRDLEDNPWSLFTISGR